MKKLNSLVLALIFAATLSAAPTLTAVTINHAVRGTSGLHLVISGHGFSTTAGTYSVALVPPSGSFSTPINGTAVTFVDSNTLIFTADIPAATDTGWYELDVNDGVNFPVLAHAFHVLLSAPAGISDITANVFMAYPNPVSAALTIESGQTISDISLISLSGQKVLAQSVNADKATINVQGIAPGIYILNVADRSGAISYRRVVIE